MKPESICKDGMGNVDMADDAENQLDREGDKRRGVGMC